MKPVLPFFALLLPLLSYSQSNGILDTLLVQYFTIDPTNIMLDEPTGFDQEWVNWDGDHLGTLCHEPGSNPVPGSWYWDYDLGDISNPPVNSALTSCSWLSNPLKPNNNWLITPPLFIPDSTVALSWKSLAFEGPAFTDGYRVLISSNSNLPASGDFDSTLFVGAQMTKILVEGSLDPKDYIFSPGYVHAKKYTDTTYFFLFEPDAYAYRGRLEPHTVSLAPYAGRVVYIAFVHDSRDDSSLQIDDISVVQGVINASPDVSVEPPVFALQPNPAVQRTTAYWNIQHRDDARLLVSDCLGKIVLEKTVDKSAPGQLELDIQNLPAGLYTCTLRTSGIQQTALLVKQ